MVFKGKINYALLILTQSNNIADHTHHGKRLGILKTEVQNAISFA